MAGEEGGGTEKDEHSDEPVDDTRNDLTEEVMRRFRDPIERSLTAFEEATAAGNIGATLDALVYCMRAKVSAPHWLLLAALDLSTSAIKGEDRNAALAGITLPVTGRI